MPPFVLRFGIPSLDRLLTGPTGTSATSVELPTGIVLDTNETASLSIIGPDGTGKSVLGLHLASRYAADCWERGDEDTMPFVIYISTDLTYEVAKNRLWHAFRLDSPARRIVPFARVDRYTSLNGSEVQVELESLKPLEGMAQFLQNRPFDDNSVKVGFIDLARNTAGDDWSYVTRVLALLPQPEVGSPKHLIVIDAVEGFEALVGERDAFGEPASRRGRIAQIMRLAASNVGECKGKCNMILIAEERHRDERLPEVFITDFVIRLREVEANGYVRRAVQVEKGRGHSHARGQHPFVIRSGRGSTTGAQENCDDPEIQWDASGGGGRIAVSMRHQAYFHVFRSVHYLSRRTMQRPGAVRPRLPSGMFAGFGIQNLDDMLGGTGIHTQRVQFERYDTSGLPCGSVTGLIGDSETQKTRLGRAFLSRCFASYPTLLVNLIQDLRSRSTGKKSLLKKVLEWRSRSEPDFRFSSSDIERDISELVETHRGLLDLIRAVKGSGQRSYSEWNRPRRKYPLLAGWLLSGTASTHPEEGVAILLTTQDVDNKTVARDFSHLLLRHGPLQNPWQDEADRIKVDADLLRQLAEHHFSNLTICRRLEIHDLSSPIMMHIVQSCVQKAQRLQVGPKRSPEPDQRFLQSVGIRLVIDDFSVIRAIYPEVRTENLLLPYLLFYLRREGITTLVINTDPEKPGTGCSDRFEQEFRTLVDNRLYTWHVPFFGEDKVAIAAIPPMEKLGPSQQPTVVRELLPARHDPVDLVVDPHFELYTGLEDGKPEPVPLEILLYQETPAFQAYIDHENLVYRELFQPAPNRGGVIVGQPQDEYEALHDFCSLASHRHLNHSLIFQVDEFWAVNRGALRKQDGYLTAQTTDIAGTQVPAVDPLKLFQESEGMALAAMRAVHDSGGTTTSSKQRRQFYWPRGYSLGADDLGMDQPDELRAIDRVPFTWDFGFLLCRERCWAEAAQHALTLEGRRGRMLVGNVWNDLKKITPPPGRYPTGGQARTHLNVRPFEPLKPETTKTTTSWRAFLEACQIVARVRGSKATTPLPAFDLSLLAPESFSCLVLEMWASEILKSSPDLYTYIYRRRWHEGSGQSLSTWLGGDRPLSIGQTFKNQCRTWLTKGRRTPAGNWLDLYKVWLLLAEVLNLSEFVEPARSLEFKPRESAHGSVAVRHWYKTAASQSDAFDPSDPLLPCRLPGSFSARGDWFLAVKQGSRSDRLADQALDLLSSRRANLTRLQMGLGLPTRWTVADPENAMLPHELMRVKLFRCGGDGERERATYRELLSIGASKDEQFYWLWRSRLEEYDRHARVWQKWLGRTLLFWNRLRYDLGQDWISGFQVYDWVERGETDKLLGLPSLTSFADRCDFLMAELQDATMQRF